MTLRLNRARAAVRAEDSTKQDENEASEDEDEQQPQPPAAKGKAKSKAKAKAEEPEQKEEASEEEENTEKNEASSKGARTAERNRFKAILNAEHADGFQNLAMHLATETNLSAATAAGILAAAMEDVSTDASGAAPAKASDRSKEFRAAMNNDAPNPKLGAGKGGREAEEDEYVKAMRDMGLHKDCKA